MDCRFPVVADDGDLQWSDSHSMDSDESHSIVAPHSPLWMDHFQARPEAVPVSSTFSLSHTGQLSPVSTGMDIPTSFADHRASASGASGLSSTPTLIHSASSSCTDSWSNGYADVDDAPDTGNDLADMHWEQGSDDILTVAKVEPLEDDDFRLEDVKEAPMQSLQGLDDLKVAPDMKDPAAAPPKIKRPRGRPRKHPLTPVVTNNKVTKGRSKTGCLTCRKRKKKCDEAKPRCMNCEKNAVVCEGYPEKQIWKSGKERAEEERLKSQHLPSITMQPIFPGLETVEDRIFWKHYNEHLSNVLTVEGEHKNAFKDMIVPIAVNHQGLMHSILSLASKHIDYDTPYGMNILRKNPTTTVEALQRRSDFHHEAAMERLYADLNREHDRSSPECRDILSARYGQMLCLLLESIAEGNHTGSHRVHLQAYRNLIQQSPPEDQEFLSFITEFFQYHIFADELICLPDGESRFADELMSFSDGESGRSGSRSDLPVPQIIHPPRLLGVADGLFNYLSHITTIRNTIRSNLGNHIDPVVDYTSLYQAAEIDVGIREWTPSWLPGDSRDRVGLLYKQMLWIYLFRTIYPPTSSPSTSSASASAAISASSASSCLSTCSASMPMLPTATSAGRPAIANTSPHSVTTSCSSSPRLAAQSANSSASSSHSNPPSRKSSSVNAAPSLNQEQQHGHQPEARPDTPQPIRQPPNHDPRITLAIEESLTILDSFKASDPSQTLLLIPCLVIGTACFSPAQRERIRTAVRTVRGYTGLRNTDRVSELLEEIWRLMDVGDWVAVWDWQRVARNMELDFLCA